MTSLLAVAICVMSGAIRKRLFSPIYLYATALSAYPLAVWAYSEIIQPQYLPQIFPYFNDTEKDIFYLLSFFAVMSLLLADFLLIKSNRVKYQIPKNTKVTSYSKRISAVFSLLIVLIILAFVLTNRAEFLTSYIYQLLRVSEFDANVANKINIYSTLETIFLINSFFVIIFWDGQPYKSKVFILSIILFVIIKLLIGSRMMLVPLFLIALLFYRENMRSTNALSLSKTHLKIYISLTLLIITFIAVNYLRDRGSSITLYESWMHFTHEYLFASISALYSVRYVDIGNTPNGIMMMFDGIIGIMPSFMFGGVNEKNSFLEFSQWRNSIGGFSSISPVGGYYMPGQVYLMTKSIPLTALFFFIIGCLICTAEKAFYSSNKIWVKVAAAQIACFGIVYGVRTEFWIFEKFIIQQALFTTIVIALFYSILYKLFSRPNNV